MTKMSEDLKLVTMDLHDKNLDGFQISLAEHGQMFTVSAEKDENNDVTIVVFEHCNSRVCFVTTFPYGDVRDDG